jgi:hypothetical protein
MWGTGERPNWGTSLKYEEEMQSNNRRTSLPVNRIKKEAKKAHQINEKQLFLSRT